MKLLLTSKFITNNSIKNGLIELLEKDISEIQIAFITTSGYFAEGDKKWFVDEMMSVRALNPRFFELIEIYSLSRKKILERLESSDVVCLSGGHAAALMQAIDSKDLRGVLKDFAKNKVYCGSSASSHIASKDLEMSTRAKNEAYFKENNYQTDTALGLVDFYVRAHYKDKPNITEEYVAEMSKKLKGNKIYAIDNQSAVSVNGNVIKVISEGDYKIFE